MKESREARFWLRVAEAKRLGDDRRRKYLLQESNELVSIYVVIVRKLKAKLRMVEGGEGLGAATGTGSEAITSLRSQA